MSAPAERTIEVNGHPCRVWDKGEGAPLGYLAGLLGQWRWSPFLERLSQRRRVIVPSLPGFAGGSGHGELDTVHDWTVATLDLLDAAGLDGADLVGSSIGGSLALEAAAVSRASVRKLVVIAPLGLYVEAEPPLDCWAQPPGTLPSLLTARPEAIAAQLAIPEGEDEIEWQVRLARANEAAARLLWPTGDTGLARRLHRVTTPTLLLWGAEDRVVPASYAKRLDDAIPGSAGVRSVAEAGHLADLDQPDACADAVLAFLDA